MRVRAARWFVHAFSRTSTRSWSGWPRLFGGMECPGYLPQLQVEGICQFYIVISALANLNVQSGVPHGSEVRQWVRQTSCRHLTMTTQAYRLVDWQISHQVLQAWFAFELAYKWPYLCVVRSLTNVGRRAQWQSITSSWFYCIINTSVWQPRQIFAVLLWCATMLPPPLPL